MVKKLLGVFLVGIAVVVAAHFILTAFYEDAVDIDQIWYVLNWFMALAVVAVVIVHYLRQRALIQGGPGQGITREYLEVNLAFYASAFLALWFFWNWFDDLAVSPSPQGDVRLILWAFVDPLFILISATTGCQLWRDTSRR